MIFAVFVVALALAPGLQSAAVGGDLPSIITLPSSVDGQRIQIQTLPAFLPPIVVAPELRPEPVPEVEAVVPELITVNPCDACFEYMTSLIDQLTEVAVPEIEAHPMPEAEVLPEVVAPEFEIVPHPMPQVEVLPQVRPLPIEFLRM